MNAKARPTYMLPTIDSLCISRYTHRETESMGRGVPANGNKKKAGVAILISDNIDFKTKTGQETKKDITYW